MNWRAEGVCFQFAEILRQDGGCVSGTTTCTKMTYIRQKGGIRLIHGSICVLLVCLF